MSPGSSPTSPTRSAIVTGGSKGLGRELVAALAREPEGTTPRWHVVTDARDGDGLRTSVAGFATVTPLTGDVGDPAHRAELVATATGAAPLSLLIANAGTLGPTPLPPLAEVDLDDLGQTLAINTTAQLGLAQLALPALRKSRGTLVFVTSDAAVEGYPGWGAYGASKAALEHLGRVLGAEEPSVRVLIVDPGDMRTAMHQAAFPDDDISDRPLPAASVPGFLSLIEGDQPSGRYQAMRVI